MTDETKAAMRCACGAHELAQTEPFDLPGMAPSLCVGGVQHTPTACQRFEPVTDETKAALLKVAEYVGAHAWRESRFLEPNPAHHVEVQGLLDAINELGVPAQEIGEAVQRGQGAR